MTILDHGLMDLEVLKPIFTAIALLEFHLTRPFHTLWIMECFFFFTSHLPQVTEPLLRVI